MDAWLEPGVMPCDTTTTKIGHMDRQRSRAIGNDPPSVRAYATSRSDSSLGATCSRASPFAAQASRIMTRLRFSGCASAPAMRVAWHHRSAACRTASRTTSRSPRCSLSALDSAKPLLRTAAGISARNFFASIRASGSDGASAPNSSDQKSSGGSLAFVVRRGRPRRRHHERLSDIPEGSLLG